MKEMELLIRKSQRFLKTAEVLIKERDFDSSISRSYYAMFYSVQALLLTKELSFSSHKGIISGFGEHFIKTNIFPKEMGREINRAFEKRQIGDYDYSMVLSKEEAEEILTQAQKFIDNIVAYLKRNKTIK